MAPRSLGSFPRFLQCQWLLCTPSFSAVSERKYFLLSGSCPAQLIVIFYLQISSRSKNVAVPNVVDSSSPMFPTFGTERWLQELASLLQLVNRLTVCVMHVTME